MTLNDLELKYRGWTELREYELFDRWERTRMIALSSLSEPTFQGPKSGRDFNNRFPNPYAKKKEKAGHPMTPEEITEKVERLDELEYKEYHGR